MTEPRPAPDGGYLIPEVAERWVPKPGMETLHKWVSALFDDGIIGWRIANAINKRIMMKEKWYPYKEIIDAIQETEVNRD